MIKPASFEVTQKSSASRSTKANQMTTLKPASFAAISSPSLQQQGRQLNPVHLSAQFKPSLNRSNPELAFQATVITHQLHIQPSPRRTYWSNRTSEYSPLNRTGFIDNALSTLEQQLCLCPMKSTFVNAEAYWLTRIASGACHSPAIARISRNPASYVTHANSFEQSAAWILDEALS